MAERIVVGDSVYLYSDHSRARTQDRYLVVEVSGSFCNIGKIVDTQLCSTSYRVKASDRYRVPSEDTDFRTSASNKDADSSGTT